MNRLQKALLIFFSACILLILGALLIARIYLTDDRIREIAEPLLEQQLGRDVSIGGFDIRLLRSLPNLAVGITDIAIHTASKDENPSPDLAQVQRIWVEMPLLPLLKSNIHIKALELDNPQILVEVYEDLSSNLIEFGEVTADSASTEGSEASENTEIALERVTIRDGQIGYVHADGTLLTMDGMNADLSARLSELSTLQGWMSVEDMYYESGGISYANHWTIGLDVIAETHLDSAWLRLDKADLSVQDLVLQLNGRVDDFDSDRVGVDLSLNTPDAAVSSFWSLLPESLVKDYSGLESEGVFSVDGTVSGEMAEGVLPELDVNFKVVDGAVRYPDLPSAIQNLTLDANLTSSGLDVRTFKAEADGAQLQARAMITDFANPSLDADVDLNLDLASIQNYYPLDDSTELGGGLQVDTQIRGSLDQVDNLDVAGFVEFASVDYRSSLVEQPVEELKGRIVLRSDQIMFDDISLLTGQSDIEIDGLMTGYEAFLSPTPSSMPDPLIQGVIKSSYLNLTEQISEDTTSSFVGPLELPPIQMDVSVEAGEIEFNGITLTDASGKLSLVDGIMGFEDIRAQLFNGVLSANGSFDLSDPLKPVFNGGVSLDQLPVQEFFSAFSDMNALIYLGSYLDGLFDSKASFGLELDKDLNPQYESVIASGVFGARNGSFGTMPLQTVVARFTGVSALESLDIDEWSHAFSVSGERLNVQDLQFSAGEYGIALNGSQSFDGGLDYKMRVILPESASNTLSNAPIQGALGSITSVVNTTLKDPESGRIILDMLASGTFQEPVVKLDSDRMKTRLTTSLTEGVKNEAEARIDSLEQSARDRAEAELEEQRKRLEDRAEEEIQTLVGGLVDDSSAVSTSLDSLKEKGADALQDRLKGLLNRKKRNN